MTCEQYSRIHLAGPKIAICETATNAVFVLNSAFTSKDQYFQTAIQEAILAFNNILKDFGFTQTLEYYDPHVHQAHPPPQHPLFQQLPKTFTHFYLLFNYISSLFLHPSSMMSDMWLLITPPKNYADTSHCFTPTLQMVNINHRHWVLPS